jgi:hypothetical protein
VGCIFVTLTLQYSKEEQKKQDSFFGEREREREREREQKEEDMKRSMEQNKGTCYLK